MKYPRIAPRGSKQCITCEVIKPEGSFMMRTWRGVMGRASKCDNCRKHDRESKARKRLKKVWGK